MRRTEQTANLDLVRAAARFDWEGAHMDAWQAPAPQRRRNDPMQRAARRVDAVLVLMLACTVAALASGVL